MAKVKLHPMFRSLHGKSGDVVYKKSKSGKQIVTKMPDMSNVKWSQNQTDHRSHMGEIFSLASQVTKDPELRPFFEKLAKEENKKRRRRNRDEGEISTYNMAVRYLSHNGEIPKS